ncbi:MAG: TlpA family protein disulfide reductase [Bacteroidia bacterium]|nr:TlpA family protein disulfide reductase [Bacteroidia bacterium]
MKSTKILLFLIFTLLLNSSKAQNFFIKFDGDFNKLNVSSYSDFLNGERQALELAKLDSDLYQVNVSSRKNSIIIFSYEGKFSHPYYLDKDALDTIALIIEPRLLSILNAKGENKNIQYFETCLNHLFNRDINNKSKIIIGKTLLDSLDKQANTIFEKSSLYFQYYMFSYLLNKQMKLSDKKMIQWSKSLKTFPINPEIGAMMAFYMVTNTPLWHCAQHTQLNIPFLRIKTKENLYRVIFEQKIYLHTEYQDLSNYLKIKQIVKTKAYLGPTDDITGIIDTLSSSAKSDYLKDCYTKLKSGNTAKDKKFNKNILTGYPFRDKNGNEVYIDSLLGKYILIDFWATWCKPCIASFEKLKKLHKAYSDSLVILSINVDDSFVKMVNFLNKRTDLNWNFYYNGLNESVLSRFDVVAYPHYAILDKEGHIMFKQIDGLNSKELLDLLNKININKSQKKQD